MMTTLQGLQRINRVHNAKYKPSGIKSYAWLMQKWGFEPTMEGPLFQMHKEHSGPTSIFHKITGKSGKTSSYRVLAKKAPSGGSAAQAGEVTSEDVQNDSMYLSPVTIGTPGQTLMLDFDTGSSDLWVWSSSLPKTTTASASGHVIYDPTKSSTAKTAKGSTWKISYGDSSSASGTVVNDTVKLGGLTITNQAIETATKLSTQFAQGEGDGLLGLAWGNINTVSPKQVQTPVENMISEAAIPKASELFTANLGSWRDANEPDKGISFYTFGYIDQDVVKASGQEISWTPVDNSQGFWTIDSTSMTVNGKTVAQTGNTAIMDTGTTLALVADATCKAIYAAIPGAEYDSQNQGWVYPSNTTADKLPVITFALGGKQFTINKEDLGFADAGNGMIYGGIQSRGTMDFDILGDTMLKNIYAIFDQGNVRFGCVQRPETAQNVSAPPS